MVKLPPEIQREIERRHEEARASAAAMLSQDGSAVMIFGTLGLHAYLSPNGEAFIERYQADGEHHVVDRSERAEALALALGADRIPALRALIPAPPPGAAACDRCSSTGWLTLPHQLRIICDSCDGLGWLSDRW